MIGKENHTAIWHLTDTTTARIFIYIMDKNKERGTIRAKKLYRVK